MTRGSTLWAVQYVEPPDLLPIITVRLLAIDISSGTATEIPLPEAELFVNGAICVLGETLYAGGAIVVDQVLASTRLYERPATTDPSEWTRLSEEPGGRGLSSGGVACAEDLGEVFTWRGNYPMSISTWTIEDRARSEPVSPQGLNGFRLLGLIDGVALAESLSNSEQVVLAHERGGGWSSSGASVDMRGTLVVIDGRLVDVRNALESTHPTSPFRDIPLD